MEAGQVEQGQQEGVRACRRCIFWKRSDAIWGTCYGGPHPTQSLASHVCPEFYPKTTYTDVPVTPEKVTPYVSASGAKSSDKAKSYHLINVELLDLLADRLDYGAEKHGDPHNYRLGNNDAAYFADRVNHVIRHAVKLGNATTTAERDKQIAAIAAGCNILAWLNAHSAKVG